MSWRFGFCSRVLTISCLAVIAGASTTPAGIVVTAGPGSNVTCTITSTVKLSVKLKNNWVKADHATDPDVNVENILDTDFAGPPVPVTTKATAKGTCTGSVTDGTNTLTVTKVKITATTTSAGTDPPTCASLLTLASGSTFFDATVAFSAQGGKVSSSTLHASVGALIDSHGFGFQLIADGNGGTSVTGSFAGGSAVTNAYVDAGTLAALTGSPASSTVPKTTVCEASLKIKKPNTPDESVKLVKPKGFNKFKIGPSTNDSTPSTVAFAG